MAQSSTLLRNGSDLPYPLCRIWRTVLPYLMMYLGDNNKSHNLL